MSWAVSQGCSHWDWIVYFQDHLHECWQAPVPYCLLTRDIRSCPHESRHRLSEYFYKMAANFLRSEWSKTQATKTDSTNVFYNLTLEVAYHYFYYMLLVTQTNSGIVWEGTAQQGEYQEAGVLRNHLGGWLPHGCIGTVCFGPYFCQLGLQFSACHYLHLECPKWLFSQTYGTLGGFSRSTWGPWLEIFHSMWLAKLIWDFRAEELEEGGYNLLRWQKLQDIRFGEENQDWLKYSSSV